MAFMALEYPKTVFLCKVSPSDTKKSKTNIKNHFRKFLAFKAQKIYELAFMAFVELNM